jgi:hypothetical protein
VLAIEFASHLCMCVASFEVVKAKPRETFDLGYAIFGLAYALTSPSKFHFELLRFRVGVVVSLSHIVLY